MRHAEVRIRRLLLLLIASLFFFTFKSLIQAQTSKGAPYLVGKWTFQYGFTVKDGGIVADSIAVNAYYNFKKEGLLTIKSSKEIYHWNFDFLKGLLTITQINDNGVEESADYIIQAKTYSSFDASRSYNGETFIYHFNRGWDSSLYPTINNSIIIVVENEDLQIKKEFPISSTKIHKTINYKELKQRSDSLEEYIQALKIEFIQNYIEEDSLLFCKIFITGKGNTLKAQIDNYKSYIQNNFIEEIEPDLIDEYLSTDVLDKNKFHTWEEENFSDLPLVAITTLLSKMQVNISDLEGKIIENSKN